MHPSSTLHFPRVRGRRYSPLGPTPREWVQFWIQVVCVAMVEIGNDIFRGNFVRPDPARALRNAHDIIAFESQHGFFAEPAIQLLFRHSPVVLGIPIPWTDVVRVADSIYAFAHLGVTLGVAIWIFVAHRRHFHLFRNVAFLATIFAVIGYELLPTAPPRLTTGIVLDHRPFHFVDTMGHVLGTGTINGTPIAYNPFSAMPSLHMAWAIIAGISVVTVARQPLLRLAGALYPLIMLFTVVVTANHYLLDAFGAVVVVALAVVVGGIVEMIAAHQQRHTPLYSDSLPAAGKAA